MPLPLSSEVVQRKNSLAESDPWLLLLEINYPDETPIRLVWNTESISWDGEIWEAAAFELGDQEESNEDDTPSVKLGVVDIERKLIPLIDQYDGGIGAEVTIRVVHSAYLGNNTPELEEDYEIIDVSVDAQSRVNFKLGAENLSNYRSPPDIFLQGHCRYKTFKGNRCGYDGDAEDCDRTFERCRELNNQERFGGFPGLSPLGYWS